MPYGIISLHHHNFIEKTATCQVVKTLKVDKWQRFGIGLYFNIYIYIYIDRFVTLPIDWNKCSMRYKILENTMSKAMGFLLVTFIFLQYIFFFGNTFWAFEDHLCGYVEWSLCSTSLIVNHMHPC